MSNGDSPDGFLFPPFIPPARRAETPAAPPAPPLSEAPPAAPQSGAPARPTLPWDVETPIVRDQAAAPPAAADEAAGEELPWLERPEPRAAESAAAAPEAPAAPAQDDAFPDWLAWDDRATDDARDEVSGTAPLEGLEDFAPAGSFGGSAAAAEPETGTPDPADSAFWSLDAPEAAEPPPVSEAATPAPALGTPDPADPAFWSLNAPEAVEPPPVAESAAEPAFDVTLEEGAITFAAAAEPEAAEPDPFTSASVAEAEAAAPAVEVEAPAEEPPLTAAANGAFAEVAARLEDIARTLRERPDELLSGAASDPLALLVAGYVMGYGARR